MSKFVVDGLEICLASESANKTKAVSKLLEMENISPEEQRPDSVQGKDNGCFIKALDDIVAKQICTGQVVVNLAGACRELIDNALDAGATNIEIKAKENGVESLELIDNGHGIEKSNFDYLCKAHSTSKLTSFEDFNKLTTFGFRGEALFALAALSEITIITRDKSAPAATKLTFDRNGIIVKKENCARQVGTSVTIARLFYCLPVRQQEFQRNSRKEYSKMLHCVQSFALSSKTRFTCTNLVNGKQYTMLSSPGNTHLKETISSLFGAKAEKGNILEIQQALPDNDDKAQYGIQDNEDESVFQRIRLSGMVSSSEFGQGRSASDRQFIYVNGRPVDLPRLNRIANEVYNLFNRGRFCMLVLFIDVDPGKIDVNVSPDKRTVFFQQEKELFAKLRASLMSTFSKVLGICPKSTAKNPIENETLDRILPQTQMSDDEMFGTQNDGLGELDISGSSEPHALGLRSILLDRHPFGTNLSANRKRVYGATESSNDIAFRPKNSRSRSHRTGNESNDAGNGNLLNYMFTSEERNINRECLVTKELNSFKSLRAVQPKIDEDMPLTRQEFCTNEGTRFKHGVSNLYENVVRKVSCNHECQSEDVSSSSNNVIMRPQQNLVVNMDSLKAALIKRRRMQNKVESNLRIMKSSDMDTSQTDESAEQNLSMLLRKNDFALMELVGQFNNSFILTRLGNQMFMIDQHASDEKYNFEQLQRDSRVGMQRLVQPQNLQLSAVQENVLRDNMDVLQGNGFDFSFSDSEPIGNRINLIALPVIRGCEFNSDDVDEILSFLVEFPGTFYRPKKISRLFASKACRKSVMFGKALNYQQMKTIVQGMGTMDAPWNCPHGRPTIRHLCTINGDSL